MKKIHLNQLGYLRGKKKTAVITWEAETFQIIENQNSVYTGKVEHLGFDESAGEDVYQVDFSSFDKEGTYQIKVDNVLSYSFKISADLYKDVHKAMIKALYFQRCGTELKEEHAGIYKHPICHSEKSILLEDQTVKLDLTGGWHDAGDFGRYIPPAATTIGHLLYAYILFPNSFKDDLNIPESGNGVPDVLNESRYELDWMLKMQAPNGGAYHKLTSFTHANFVMPQEDKKQMLAFPVSSMATGAFSASMALAYYVFKDFDEEYAQKLLDASKKAYSWLEENPNYVGFENPKGCNTGAYDDDCDLDERFWAAAELYKVTKEEKYLNDFLKFLKADFDKCIFGWVNNSAFALLSYLTNNDIAKDDKVLQEVKNLFIAKANEIKSTANSGKYGVSLSENDYVWGSNMVVATNAMVLIVSHLLCQNDNECEDIALAQLDYLLGKNAVGYSYITGFGENSCNNVHNRPTVTDDIDKCIEGWVAGGANGKPGDEKAEWIIIPNTPPMKCYLDIWECYSLNEITIYWNSPTIFTTAYFNN